MAEVFTRALFQLSKMNCGNLPEKAYIVTFTLFLKNSIMQFCPNICFENVLTDFCCFAEPKPEDQ